MALSRSMKNLMHDSAMARRGGGNPTSGGGMSGMVGRAMQQASRGYGTRNPGPAGAEAPTGRFDPRSSLGGTKPTPGGTGGTRGPVMTPGGGKIRPPMGRGKPRRGMAQIAVPGGRMPRGGVMGGPAGRRGPGTVAGKPMPRGGTGGVVGPTRPGAGTFGFAARGGGGTPALQQATGRARNVVGTAAARARGPAALAKPRGQSVAARIGGQQGPPARRGGMARALGSGGSRRRMLR